MDHAALTLRNEAWSEEAAAMLAPIATADPFLLDSWADGVASGRVALIGVYRADAELIGRALVEVNTFPAGREFHLMAAVGRDEVPLASTVLPHFEAKAGALGCRHVRIATGRDGLVRVLEGRGYRHVQRVMVRDV